MSEQRFVPPTTLEQHRPAAEEFLSSLLKLMNYSATFEMKDMPDGALGVALNFEGEPPGVRTGKRTHLVDCMQFILNKAVNRPNLLRRWVNLGVNRFPDPKPERHPTANGASTENQGAPKASAPLPMSRHNRRNGEVRNGPRSNGAASEATSSRRGDAPRSSAPRDGRRANGARTGAERSRSNQVDEATLSVSPDPLWTRLGKSLAEKSKKHGWTYGVMLLDDESRARALQACAGADGVSVRAEGEGHWRRLTYRPDKIAPILRPVAHDDELG